MRKVFAVLLSAALLLGLCACGAPAATAEPAATQAPAPAATAEPAEETELIVFAAASMTETLDTLIGMYKEVAPQVTIVPNYDSSGTLKTQIQEGADCDIFISAGQKQMNQLDKEAGADLNTEGLDFVLQGSRFNILENKVVLVVPAGESAGAVTSFEDLKAGLEAGTVTLAMGNSYVPVGQYTQKILAYFGLDEAALAASGVITYGSNVKEVTTQVSEVAVDCGVIYATDLASANRDSEVLLGVDAATAEMCGQVIYPAAILNISQNTAAAQAFLEYLTTPEAMAVFEAVGFSPVA